MGVHIRTNMTTYWINNILKYVQGNRTGYTGVQLVIHYRILLASPLEMYSKFVLPKYIELAKVGQEMTSNRSLFSVTCFCDL